MIRFSLSFRHWSCGKFGETFLQDFNLLLLLNDIDLAMNEWDLKSEIPLLSRSFPQNDFDREFFSFLSIFFQSRCSFLLRYYACNSWYIEFFSFNTRSNCVIVRHSTCDQARWTRKSEGNSNQISSSISSSSTSCEVVFRKSIFL